MPESKKSSKDQKKVIRPILGALVALVLLFALVTPIRDTFSFLWQLVFHKDVTLQKTDNRIDILLLGAAGGRHEGKDLTDTIIVLSLDPTKKEAILTSIPRDLWIPELSSKINTAYASGEEKQRGGGLILSKAVAKKVTGLEISYAIKVDFDGFVKAVDAVSGLEIDVENTFQDPGYPIEGKENDLCGLSENEVEKLATQSSRPWEALPCRFELVRFEKGSTKMDGTTALKFVRSRNAQDSEGTDFARSRRQQKVLSAFSDKIFSLGVLLNPLKVQYLYGIVREHIESDISTSELDDFIRLANQMEGTKVRNIVIDYGDEENGRKGLLVNPPITSIFGYQWVLIPRAGTGEFSQIQEYVACKLILEDCPIN